MRIIDRVVSGNSFVGGFIYALVSGVDLKDAAELGVAASAETHDSRGFEPCNISWSTRIDERRCEWEGAKMKAVLRFTWKKKLKFHSLQKLQEFESRRLFRWNKMKCSFFRIDNCTRSSTLFQFQLYFHRILLTGKLKPSTANQDLFWKIKLACYYHHIKVSDDVVGKNEGYYSFAEDRLIYIPIFKNSL